MSTLADALLRMTKRERLAFCLGILTANPKIPTETITRMALAFVERRAR